MNKNNDKYESPKVYFVTFPDAPPEGPAAVVTIDDTGFYYRGKLIKDAGAAYHHFAEVLHLIKQRNTVGGNTAVVELTPAVREWIAFAEKQKKKQGPCLAPGTVEILTALKKGIEETSL